ncbi:hypothetical protein Tsubulata_009186, partial [Turnera subulata]
FTTVGLDKIPANSSGICPSFEIKYDFNASQIPLIFASHWEWGLTSLPTALTGMFSTLGRLKQALGTTPSPKHRTLPECSCPRILPTASLGAIIDSSIVLCVIAASSCAY